MGVKRETLVSFFYSIYLGVLYRHMFRATKSAHGAFVFSIVQPGPSVCACLHLKTFKSAHILCPCFFFVVVVILNCLFVVAGTKGHFGSIEA